MRPITTILILFLLFSTQISCNNKHSRSQEPKALEVIETPQQVVVKKDTVVIRDTVTVFETVEKVVRPVVVETRATQPVKSNASSSAAINNQEKDRYDRSNSGFFDSYQDTYTGDPNKDLKVIRIERTNIKEVNSQKEAVEREIEALENKNRLERERHEKRQKEIDEYNRKAIEEAQEQQKQYDLEMERRNNKGKTLDTNLLLKK